MSKRNKKCKVFEASYPIVYKEILTVCIGMCLGLMALLEIVYGIKENKEVFVLLVIMCLLIWLLRIGVSRYSIIVNEENIVVTPLIGKKRTIVLSDIDELRESKSGGLSIICKATKVITIDRAIEGYEQLCKVIEKYIEA